MVSVFRSANWAKNSQEFVSKSKAQNGLGQALVTGSRWPCPDLTCARVHSLWDRRQPKPPTKTQANLEDNFTFFFLNKVFGIKSSLRCSDTFGKIATKTYVSKCKRHSRASHSIRENPHWRKSHYVYRLPNCQLNYKSKSWNIMLSC